VSEAIFAARPGERLRMRFRRHGRSRTAGVRLSRRPSVPPPEARG
jgi:hypothetical protein